MKVATIVGARPQFIKAAVVSRALRNNEGLKEVIIHTGQHYDENLSEIFFTELDIPRPDYNLGIGSSMHGAMTGKMLESIEEVLLKIKADIVLVYGDTNSTLAGSLAAAKLHVPVAHVEAGLRSFNRKMPEEINRVLTDYCSDLLFAPTDTAVVNLRNEGIPESRIFKVGDVMYDAALFYAEKAEAGSRTFKELQLERGDYVLATIHRAENTDLPDRLSAIIDGLIMVADKMPVLLPLHPRTRAALQVNGFLERAGEKLTLLEPQGYLDMVMLEKNAALIATDSGGVQKEAFFYRVPCVTLRDETEWVELVDSGWNYLCPPADTLTIGEVVRERIDIKGKDVKLYGNGDAAIEIVKIILTKQGNG